MCGHPKVHYIRDRCTICTAVAELSIKRLLDKSTTNSGIRNDELSKLALVAFKEFSVAQFPITYNIS